MAQLIIDIPDEHVQRIVDAFCTTYNYEENGAGMTKVQFVKKHIIGFIKATTLRVEGQLAARDANQAKADEINGIPIE